jgi:hypothetical protein
LDFAWKISGGRKKRTPYLTLVAVQCGDFDVDQTELGRWGLQQASSSEHKRAPSKAEYLEHYAVLAFAVTAATNSDLPRV